MSIIHNLQDISTVTIGSENIENIYLGEDLLWTAETSPYTPDQVIFEQSTAGTYSLDILADGQYEVYCIGGGAGCSSFTMSGFAAGGGSGAGFIGIIRIEKNNYTITVGNCSGNVQDGTVSAGGNSSIGSIIISYGAKSHHWNPAGAGGDLPYISTNIISQSLNSMGNSGTADYGSANGGASLYNNYGKGGGFSNWSFINGTAGYVKIVYKGK